MVTGAERLQALRDRVQQMPDCEIIQRLGDINQRGRVEALLTAFLLAGEECRKADAPRWAPVLEPGIEAMLVDAADRWGKVLL